MPFRYDDNEAGSNATPKQPHGTVELRDYLKAEFKRMDIDYQKRAKFWNTLHGQFRGIVEKGATQVIKSRLFINKTRVAVRSGLANVLDVLFPGQDFFDVLGRTEQDQQGSEIAKKVMDWILLVGEFIPEATNYVLQAAIYGTAFGKIIKQDITDTVMVKQPKIHPLLLTVTGYKTHEVKKTVSFSSLEALDIFSIHMDPNAASIETASGFFHEVHRTMQYLHMMEEQGIYENIDEVEKLTSIQKGSRSRGYNSVDKRRRSVGLPTEGIDGKDEVKLYEYWGKVPRDIAEGAGIEVKEGEFEVEIIATLANMEVLIRQERNTNPHQERMFISDVWEPSGDNSIYGVGIPENARGSQLALNATINTRLDNKAWALANPIVVDMGRIESSDDLIARPNMVIRVKGSPDDILKFAQVPDVTATTHIEAQEFERYIDDESGMNKVVQASEGFGSNRTKGGIAMAYSAASRPIRLIARGFEQNLVAKGLKKIFMLFVTNMDKSIVVRVTGDPNAPNYINVDPFSLALDVDFIPSGSFALTMRESVLDALETWMDGMSKILPSLNPATDGRPNFGYLAEKFYQGLGLKDWNKAWIPPQQAAAMMPQPQPGQGGQNVQTQAQPGSGTPGAAQGTNPIQQLMMAVAAARGRQG